MPTTGHWFRKNGGAQTDNNPSHPSPFWQNNGLNFTSIACDHDDEDASKNVVARWLLKSTPYGSCLTKLSGSCVFGLDTLFEQLGG